MKHFSHPSTHKAPEPRSFTSILEELDLIAPQNATVRDLHYANPEWLMESNALQRAINDALGEMGMYSFINLIRGGDHARIAMAMYAGDGIVAKVTSTSFTTDTIYPYQMPAIQSKNVSVGDGMKCSRVMAVEAYPWIQREGMDMSDVIEMKRTLQGIGLMFKNGDAKPDNLGRLVDGTTAVLDGDALQTISGYAPDENEVRKWVEKVERLYPVYAQKEGKLVSETPNFQEHPHARSNRNCPIIEVTQRAEVSTGIMAALDDARRAFLDAIGLGGKKPEGRQ